MPRGLTAPQLDVLRGSHECVALIYIGHTTPIYLTTAMRDVENGGNTFISSPHILDIGDIEESADLRVGTLELTLSAVEQTYVSLFLNNSMTGTPLRLWRAYMDVNWDVSFAVKVFDGVISQPSMVDGGGGAGEGGKQSTLNVRAASKFANFPAVNGRLTNDRSQQSVFPGDTGLRFASEVDQNILWGRKP